MILRRYVLRRAASRALFVLLAGLLLYIVVDVMGISQQLSRGSALQVLRLYLLRAPEMALSLLPVAVVLGPLLAAGSLARRHELNAIKSCGASMRRVAAPAFVVVGLAAALLHGLLSELVLPRTAPSAVSLQDSVFALRGPRYWSFYLPRRWMRTPQGFLYTRGLRHGQASDVTYLGHDARFAPSVLIHARTLQREGEGYLLLDGLRHDLRHDAVPEAFARLTFPERLDRGALEQHLGYPEVFGALELWGVLQARATQGGTLAPFALALWRRLGDPLLLLSLALLVTPIAAWARRGQPTERRLIEGGALIALTLACRGAFGALASTASWTWPLAGLGPAAALGALAAVLWTRLEHEAPGLRAPGR